MTTHHLTEKDCDRLRDDMLARASDTTGPAYQAWLDAVTMLDKHITRSFARRAAAKHGLNPDLTLRPAAKVQAYADTNGIAPAAKPALGLRYTR